MAPERACGADADRITLRELERQPLILYRRYKALILEAFSAEGFAPFICCTNEDARTTYTWAMKGFGIGLLPKSILRVLNPDRLICKDIASDKLMTQVAVIWEKGRYLSPLAQRFVELVKE